MIERLKANWINHVLELIVVFIGISSAFMLNNWREESGNRKLESQYLKNFLDDLAFDNNKLDTILTLNRAKIDKFTRMIEKLKHASMPADSSLLLVNDMAQIAIFIPKTITYESVKNSGNFNIIRDYDLKSKIIAYYTSLESKQLTEEYYKMYINDYIIPFLFENIDLIHSEVLNPGMLNNARFRNLVVGYFQMLTQLVSTYENIFELNEDLQETLSKKTSSK